MTIRRSIGLGGVLWLLLVTGAPAQQSQTAAIPATIKLYTKDLQVAADGSAVETLHIEIQAGNDAAVASVSQNAIPFDATMQEITVVEAHTLKADGKTVPVDAGAIYEQLPSGQQQMLSSLRAKVIVFPQFAAGDTAVYTVKLVTKHPFFENQFTFGDAFLRTMAYAEVRETVTAPKSLPLHAESHDVEFRRKDNGADVTYSWHYAAPKPVAEDPPAISPLDHMPRFFLSSFQDYAELGRTYAALTHEKLVVTPKVAALADEITAGATDRRIQAQKLYEWVSGHIRYVAIELGKGSFIPHDVDVILANGYGDCKDHDLLLQALLKAKGIAAQSILINGGNSGYSLTEVPTFYTLNHVITFAPDLNLYMDSSAGIATFGVLPLQEYGKPMVIASPSSAALGKMPLLPAGLAKITVKTVDVLDKDGQLSGTTTTTATGPYAIVLRSIGLTIQAVPDAATRVITSLGYRDATGSFTQDSPVALGPSHTITGTFKASGWKEPLAGSTSFLMPGGLRLFNISGDGIMGPYYPGKLTAKDPTLCFSAQAVEDLSLKAPAGIQFESVPKNLRVETPNLLFTAHWSLDGDTLSVHRDFTSHIDQLTCSGAVREKTAAALQQIIDSYDHTDLSFKKPGATAAKPGDADNDKGVTEQMAGKYELAIQDYDKAIAARPDNPLPYFNRGLAHDAEGQYALAIADFDKALALKADYALAYYNRAREHYEMAQYALAIPDLDKALALKPDDTDATTERGNAYLNLGQNERALADFDKATALNPNEFRAYYSRGLLYEKMGQNDRALADFDKATALKPDESGPYYDRGILYKNTRKPDQGIAEFSQAIKLKPDYYAAYRARGEAYFATKQYALAIADYDKTLSIKPDDFGAYFGRGKAHQIAGNTAAAIADYDKASALKPDDASTYFNRGLAHHAANQYTLAIADYDKALALKPNDAATYYSRGYAQDGMGRYALAIADLDKALTLKPDDVGSLDERGHAYQKLGQNDRALADFDKATALKPDDPYAYYDRGILYSDLKQPERAITELSQAIRLKPDAWFSYHARAEAYGMTKQYALAIADDDQAIKLKPDDFDNYYDRAISYLMSDQPARTVEDCNKVLALKPDFAMALMLRAAAKRKLGQNYEANIDTEKAVKLEPKLAK